MASRPCIFLSALALSVASLLAMAPDARAEEARYEGGVAWGLLSLEASAIGIGTLLYHEQEFFDDGGFLLTFAPMLLGGGVAVLTKDADPRGAYGLHGAGAMGLNLFLVGGLIDSAGESSDFRVGPTAWSLGALGVAGGAWLGATQIRGGDAEVAFMLAPTAGFAIGGLTTFIGSLFFDHTDSNKPVLIGATTGMTAGMAVSVVWTLLTQQDESSSGDAMRSGLAPTAREPSLSRQTTLFSFGGSF